VPHSLRQQSAGPFVEQISSAAVEQVASTARRDLTLRTRRRRRLIISFAGLVALPRPLDTFVNATPDPYAPGGSLEALSSLLARSWFRKALRVLRKRVANSAQELDALISTMRTASMRGRGGSALMR
jgi:hypothetical protein